ncbi:MAG TPA: phytanoyl-CoA dioxygenase family protein [Streptosporangiaceae bacterium]|nr:phytanoyl-CoA dioxygenase family protein [Streptosporangiaceae bacterium]
MLTDVTEQQQKSYAEQGFLVVENFLDPAELTEWRAAVDHAVAERGQQLLSFATSPEEDAVATRSEEERDYYDQVFTQRNNLWQTDEHMRSLLFQPGLGKFVADVAAIGGVRIWHDQALIKGPYSNPTAFHLDVPYWSFKSADAITIWIALDDATIENGCLYYVPGSHLARKFDNVSIGSRIGSLFEVYPDWADVAPVPCPVPAGGALFHNGLTFHGAGANMTPGLRRAMTCAYMPDGATFNGTRNVLPPEYFRTLEVGQVLDNDAQNPLIYSRHGTPAGSNN